MLLMAYRRKRIQRDRFLAYLRVIASLPILVDTTASTQGTTMPTVSRLAEQHTLTTYDASYLEVAMRRGLPLTTLDTALAKAAISSTHNSLTQAHTVGNAESSHPLALAIRFCPSQNAALKAEFHTPIRRQ